MFDICHSIGKAFRICHRVRPGHRNDCCQARNNLHIGAIGRCHGGTAAKFASKGMKRIAIVGSPNVGKSVMFNRLTGAYVTVSNYPGTTVEVSRGIGNFLGQEFEVIDTPGMYSLLPITEEERVSREILLKEKPDLVLHVIDAKNVRRMLVLTLQLIEAGLPVVVVLNIMDEAERKGMHINVRLLEQRLGVPVIPTVSTTGRGLDGLKQKVVDYLGKAS